ncbi:hypothetical protein BJ322DRAFT_1016782 [Thelephora terrestris]|uniref:Uncharacterized protein n=1 Tax=Thelephora terrestris TaxID=56493 RepID=A0A9P6HRA0_9AGAM|nr:hypothetical protein BJ322DRAFT_1016782 [Thelephora terrestris]
MPQTLGGGLLSLTLRLITAVGTYPTTDGVRSFVYPDMRTKIKPQHRQMVRWDREPWSWLSGLECISVQPELKKIFVTAQTKKRVLFSQKHVYRFASPLPRYPDPGNVLSQDQISLRHIVEDSSTFLFAWVLTGAGAASPCSKSVAFENRGPRRKIGCFPDEQINVSAQLSTVSSFVRCTPNGLLSSAPEDEPGSFYVRLSRARSVKHVGGAEEPDM